VIDMVMMRDLLIGVVIVGGIIIGGINLIDAFDTAYPEAAYPQTDYTTNATTIGENVTGAIGGVREFAEETRGVADQPPNWLESFTGGVNSALGFVGAASQQLFGVAAMVFDLPDMIDWLVGILEQEFGIPSIASVVVIAVILIIVALEIIALIFKIRV